MLLNKVSMSEINCINYCIVNNNKSTQFDKGEEIESKFLVINFFAATLKCSSLIFRISFP